MNAINKALSEYFYNDINDIIMDYMDIYNVIKNKANMLCSAMICAGMVDMPEEHKDLKRLIRFVNRMDKYDVALPKNDKLDII